MKQRVTVGQIAALLIAFFTLTAAAVISRTVFERLPHLEDEFAYLYQAKIFAGGHVWVERHEPVKVFWQPFVIQPETSTDGVQKRFGKYTPGWPLLLSAGVALGQPWVVNAFLGMLTVALVYRMAREIFNEPVGLASALLLAISPMALLLNGTLMSHVSAMFMGAVFVYGYWRLTRNGKRRFVWAIASGLALGWIISTRPLTAVAIAAPVILHAASRLLDTLFEKAKRPQFGRVLMPLLMLSVFVLPTGGLWPLFNQIWTGDWKTNVYQMLWPYDTVGFGPDHGVMEGGHTLEYGWRNARADLVVYFRDLFGLTLRPDVSNYLAMNIFGLTSATTSASEVAKTLNENVVWGLIFGLSWIPVAAGLIFGRKLEWVWLFFELFVAIVIAQLTYWIGSTVYGGAAYSLRYYYEATFGVCVVAGFGVVAFARSLNKPAVVGAQHAAPASTNVAETNGSESPLTYNPVPPAPAVIPAKKDDDDGRWKTWLAYIVFLIVCIVSLVGYTPARFQESLPGWPGGLFRYNKVGRNQIDAINEMRARSGDLKKSVLIIVLRDPNPLVEDNWRDYGAAMALTSPYLDSDVIVARVFEKEDASDIIQRFPGRLVLYQVGEKLSLSVEEATAGADVPGKVETSQTR